MQHDALLIFSTLVAVLAVASATAFVFSRTLTEPAIAETGNLNARVRSWWWIVLVVAAAVFAGRALLVVVFALASFVALREFLSLTAVQPEDRRVVAAIFWFVLPTQYFLAAGNQETLFIAFPVVFALLILPVLVALPGNTRNYLARASELLLAVIVCIYCVSHVPALMMLRIPGYQNRQALLIIFLVLVTQSSDVLQYVCGKLFGRHKIAPNVSPSKTVEGLVGGFTGATALAAGLHWITPFTAVQAAAIGLLMSLSGFLGGLVMSAIKRDRGVKDWSHFIAGHGGMLDRLDSICFSAPVFFHLTRFLFSQ